CVRFIPGEESWSAERQVQIAPMGGRQERMALGFMQEQEGAAAQDFAGAPNHATRKETVAVHWFSVPIQVENGHRLLVEFCGYFPQACRPGCEQIGQRLSAACLSHLAQKPLG